MLTITSAGSVVRYAPSRLVFNTLSAARGKPLQYDAHPSSALISEPQHLAIYTMDRQITKSWGYVVTSFENRDNNLFNCVDPKLAAQKKRILRSATGSCALAILDASIASNMEGLVASLRCQGDLPCDISVQCTYPLSRIVPHSNVVLTARSVPLRARRPFTVRIRGSLRPIAERKTALATGSNREGQHPHVSPACVADALLASALIL